MLEDDIKKLVKLQEVDKDLFRLKADIDSIPLKIKALDDAFSEKQKILKEIEDELRKVQLKRKEREIELETKENSIKKLQVQLYQVKTNKEYSALETEIGGLRADASVLEEEIIGYLDKVDELNKNTAEKKKGLESEKSSVESEKSRVKSELDSMNSKFTDLQKQRDEITSGIPKEVLSKYNKILQNKDGLALVKIVDGACQGCFMSMPPQVISEVKLRKDLVCCENCLRILYIDDGEEI